MESKLRSQEHSLSQTLCLAVFLDQWLLGQLLLSPPGASQFYVYGAYLLGYLSRPLGAWLLRTLLSRYPLRHALQATLFAWLASALTLLWLKAHSFSPIILFILNLGARSACQLSLGGESVLSKMIFLDPHNTQERQQHLINHDRASLGGLFMACWTVDVLSPLEMAGIILIGAYCVQQQRSALHLPLSIQLIHPSNLRLFSPTLLAGYALSHLSYAMLAHYAHHKAFLHGMALSTHSTSALLLVDYCLVSSLQRYPLHHSHWMTLGSGLLLSITISYLSVASALDPWGYLILRISISLLGGFFSIAFFSTVHTKLKALSYSTFALHYTLASCLYGKITPLVLLSLEQDTHPGVAMVKTAWVMLPIFILCQQAWTHTHKAQGHRATPMPRSVCPS